MLGSRVPGFTISSTRIAPRRHPADSPGARERGLTRNSLERQAPGPWSKQPDHEHDYAVGCRDEQKDPKYAATSKYEGDDKGVQDCREPAPRIDKTYRRGADASRKEFRLIGMVGVRNCIAEQRYQDPRQDQRDRASSHTE